LGLHVEPVETYAPLYDDGVPHVDERPGYRTIVVHTSGSESRVTAALPFLVVPRLDGGLALYAEASVSIVRPGAGSFDEGGGFYAATEIVTAADPRALDREIVRREKILRARKRWGITHSESIVYATPAATCRLFSEAEWIGGALAFSGSMHHTLVGVGHRVEPALGAYVDDAHLRAFARDVLEARRDDEEIDLDAPIDVGWERSVTLRKDAHACLAREGGQAFLSGAVVLSGNSARSFSASRSLMPVPSSFGSDEGAKLDLAAVTRAFPEATDATLSPSRATLVVLDGPTIRVFDVASERETLAIPDAASTVVLAEWSEGEVASRVDRAIDALPASGAARASPPAPPAGRTGTAK
jgi:hypothetical protein